MKIYTDICSWTLSVPKSSQFSLSFPHKKTACILEQIMATDNIGTRTYFCTRYLLNFRSVLSAKAKGWGRLLIPLCWQSKISCSSSSNNCLQYSILKLPSHCSIQHFHSEHPHKNDYKIDSYWLYINQG